MNKSSFREVFGRFGDTSFMKVLDFFLTYQEFDYSKCQIAKEVGISRITIERTWKFLIKSNYIKKKRIIGRAIMYQLNKGNPIVKALIEFDFNVSSIKIDEMKKNEKNIL